MMVYGSRPSSATRDATGQFCYLRDLTTDRRWSATHQPMCIPADWSHATLASDRVTFHRGDGDIESRTEIAVVPDDSAEVRRVTLTNHGDVPHEIELTSYGEIVLAPGASDRAHPAFSSLFVQTEWHPWCSAITATRRPRAATDARVSVRPRRNQCSTGTSFLAMAKKEARRASEASKSYDDGSSA